jgi:hypothetical protein
VPDTTGLAIVIVSRDVYVDRLDLALAHWTLRSAWTVCARVARKMRLLMLALCAITISACGRQPATVPAGG